MTHTERAYLVEWFDESEWIGAVREDLAHRFDTWTYTERSATFRTVAAADRFIRRIVALSHCGEIPPSRIVPVLSSLSGISRGIESDYIIADTIRTGCADGERVRLTGGY